ncbi:MAG: hypothetical protein ACKOF3_02380, partial [Spartobacteria bacterium]
MSLSSDTIAAIATPPGEGAIAMIRISGPDAMGIEQPLHVGGIDPHAHGAAVAQDDRDLVFADGQATPRAP